MANVTNKAKDPKASVTGGQKSSLPLSVVDKMKGKSSLPQSVVDKMKGKRDLETMKTRIGTVANKYRSPIGPSNKGSVPGGAGIPGLNNVRLRPTAKAPKATVSAKAPKATTINIPGGGLSTGKSSANAVKSTSQAMKQAPGNYSGGKVSMGGKTYNGYTVGSSTNSKGQTTKSVGNWSSTSDAGRSLGKNDVAGPAKNAAGKNASSMTGKSSGGGKTTGSTSTKSAGNTNPGGMGASKR